jgi:predicted N-acetyltransferase YhbS
VPETQLKQKLQIKSLKTIHYRSVDGIYRGAVKEYLDELQTSGRLREFDRERATISLALPLKELEFYAKKGCSFVALIGRRVVGFILVQPLGWVSSAPRTLWLEYIAVAREHRHQGVGLSLLSAVKSHARQHGIHSMLATLNVDNAASRVLLTKSGFDVREWMIAVFSE